eukprot:4988474-Pyramimonas_sp.AAC.1
MLSTWRLSRSNSPPCRLFGRRLRRAAAVPFIIISAATGAPSDSGGSDATTAASEAHRSSCVALAGTSALTPADGAAGAESPSWLSQALMSPMPAMLSDVVSR